MENKKQLTHYSLSYDEKMNSYKEEWNSIMLSHFPFYAYIRCNEIEGNCPEHWHNLIEIVTMKSGKISHSISSHVFSAETNDIIIVQPGLTHSWETISDAPVEMLVIQFPPSLIMPNLWRTVESEYIFSFLNHSNHHIEFIHNGKESHPELFELTDLIYNEFINCETGREIYIMGYIFQYIACLVRNKLIHVMDDESEQELKKIAPLLQYIEENYTSKIRLEEAAKILNYDYYYMSKVFKKLTKKTFTEYLDSVRINEAEKLMKDKSLNISDIAFSVGFENIASFNRAYKKIRNCSPSAFRQKKG